MKSRPTELNPLAPRQPPQPNNTRIDAVPLPLYAQPQTEEPSRDDEVVVADPLCRVEPAPTTPMPTQVGALSETASSARRSSSPGDATSGSDVASFRKRKTSFHRSISSRKHHKGTLGRRCHIPEDPSAVSSDSAGMCIYLWI